MDQHQKKKELETKIITTIYDSSQFKTIEATEENGLDFILTYDESSIPFGVQVTELYSSESSARIINIPNYLDTILANGAYKHRDDKIKLPCVDIAISDSEGNNKIKCKAIHNEISGDYWDNILDTVKKKETLLKPHTLLYTVNLIISDKWNPFIKKEIFFQTLLKQQIKDCLPNTIFEEVFVITQFERKSVYVPLITSVILERIYIFTNIL